ncbi:MAG: NAD(P)/FAD-dependent oxidoreductase [Bacteroidota bacterium]
MRNTIIIGAGQAGLAASYCLKQAGVPHEVLEAWPRVGDNWRNRWDSLHMFSPAPYNNLPGLPFPTPRGPMPTKDEAADYLETYVRHFDLPVSTGVTVTRLSGRPQAFDLLTSDGPRQARHIIIATGPYRTPRTPAFHTELHPDITQLHTADYRNPAQLPEGPVLVVGCGASGSQIAAEIAATHKVYLSGPNPGHAPRSIFGKDIYWWMTKFGLNRIRRDSWLGRRADARGRKKGDALVGKSLKRIMKENGILHRALMTGTENGLPVFACKARADDIRSVVWATGYRVDFSWIDFPIFDEEGNPEHTRGVVEAAKGLYFIGLRFLYRASSAQMGGVGEDAEYLADIISNNK